VSLSRRLEAPDSAAPGAEELEISLFGPGLGECVVVHLGYGRWMVVDSCRSLGSRESVAIRYLRTLGIDPARAVYDIVVTHWHDDHTGGAASMVSQCQQAKVYFPAALQTDEFLTLTETLGSAGRLLDRENNGVREMSEVLRELAQRAGKRRHYVEHHFAPIIVGREIVSHELAGQRVWVKALSPSDVAFNLAMKDLRSLIPAEGAPPRVLPRPKRNPSAVVLWLQFGAHAVLLGSDLEEAGDPYSGWSVIVADHNTPHKASVFKVPHHGSKNAHCDAVWREMLEPTPVAITTTHSPSGLPRSDDVARIKTYTHTFACTTVPRSSLPRRDPAVERVLRRVAKNRRPVLGPMGHIQLRIGGDGSQRLRGNANSRLL
jgi:beta-lactamase superfamily II metal-dependent hydrolase